jgi:hypothetical protein
MSNGERITFPTSRLLYVFFVCVVLFPVVALFAFSPTLDELWCRQFEIPDYERALGFTLGQLEVTTRRGSMTVSGFSWIDPSGPLAAAGLRSGDVPKMHHGLGDLCWALDRVSEGEAVTLSVFNVEDYAEWQGERREIAIPGASE